MTQYEWVMGILSNPLSFPEEVFSDLKKMEFESKGFFDRLYPLIIVRASNAKEVRRLFISKEYEAQWKEDLDTENRQRQQGVS